MKLTLPFLCVALLGVGIMPVAASSPISVKDETNLDPTETARAPTGTDDPSSISPDSEDGGGWYSAIANVIESVVQVTGVRLNATASGLEIILETPSGQVLQAVTRIEGKSAIADIENAQLALPSGGEFSASSPDEGIASVTVNQLEGSRIRVSF